MASFLIVTNYGDACFLALRLIREGHRVRTCIYDSQCQDVYTGMLEKTKSNTPNKGEVIIVDSDEMGTYADSARAQGFPVIGGSRWTDNLERDRQAGVKLMQQYGIKTPETHFFIEPQEGIRFISRQTGKWYYKPNDNMSESQTMCGTVDVVAKFIATYPHKGFLLQREVLGSEISLEGWFDGSKFVYPFNSTVEDKRFLAGNLGPNVGCMGNVVWTYENPIPRLAVQTINRIVPSLQRARYVGPVDLNMILTDEGPLGLEWTPRFGYDAWQALALLAPANYGEQLAAFALGNLPKFDFRGEYAVNIGVSVPPFPDELQAVKVKGTPLDVNLLQHPWRIALRDVMVDSYKAPRIAGSSGVVGSFGGMGREVNVVINEIKNFINEFQIPNKQYRIDCCDRVNSVLFDLQRLFYDLPFMAPQEAPERVAEYPEQEPESGYVGVIRGSGGSQTTNNLLTNLTTPQTDTGLPPRFE